MLPRCWLLRRSEQLEHNQCHGLFLFLQDPPRSVGFPSCVMLEVIHLMCSDSAKWKSAMKEQLESVVLQMYRAGAGVRCSEGVREFQKTFILTVLKDQRGNQCKAAERLGIHRNTLRRMIRALEIDIGPTRATGKRRPARSEEPVLLQRRAT
jgi:Fis family transcriptional regulator, factor for inversion stimulation protein